MIAAAPSLWYSRPIRWLLPKPGDGERTSCVADLRKLFGKLLEVSDRKRCTTRSTICLLRLSAELPHSFGSRTTVDSNGFSALSGERNELIRCPELCRDSERQLEPD